MMWFPPNCRASGTSESNVPSPWVPPPTDPENLSTAAQVCTRPCDLSQGAEGVETCRPPTVIHYVTGIHYEHEADDTDCDWCKPPIDSQTTPKYTAKQECDWKPPIVLADGPINRTCEEALQLPSSPLEQALAETADT